MSSVLFSQTIVIRSDATIRKGAMPRTSRQMSASGIYHVMSRGINKQQIFEDEEDYLLLLECLRLYKDELDFKLYAYCIMSNHYHLLLAPKEEDDLARILKKVGTRFVNRYNWKYRRSGHLFQDRFKSEPVESDAYFLTVLRYIHLNPVKAKMSPDPSNYQYSSYGAYLGKVDELVDADFVSGMLSQEEFMRFHLKDNEDRCLEDNVEYRTTDEEAQALIREVTGLGTPSTIQALVRSERNGVLRKLKAEKLSLRQISRLTGISKRIIEKA